MLVQAFFEWIETANASERAQAVATLARAYLAGAYGSDRPEEIEAALTFALDDSSPLVRRALAMVLAERSDAPRALVLSLARDQAEVSGLLIVSSPLLTEADLMDLAGSAERLALMAIALRPDVTMRIASAIILRDDAESLYTLLCNREARIASASLIDVAARHGSAARLREVMLQREDLPVEARHLLMRAVAESLASFVGTGGFLTMDRQKRAIGEAIEDGTLAIAKAAGADLPDFIDHLRERAELTSALLLRSVLTGDTCFVAGALAEICALPPTRVDTMIAGGSEAAIGALLRKAGLPDFIVPVMIAALCTAIRLPIKDRGLGLHLGVIRAAQAALIGSEREESLRLLALLRRYEAEAARSAARALANTLRSRLSTPSVPALSAPTMGEGMLRLASFDGADSVVVVYEADEQEAQEQDKAHEHGAVETVSVEPLISGESVPDLATLIAQWKAERASLDEASVFAGANNENAASGEAPIGKEKAA